MYVYVHICVKATRQAKMIRAKRRANERRRNNKLQERTFQKDLEAFREKKRKYQESLVHVQYI